MTEKFVVTGMTCAACAAHVEKAAGAVAGVNSAAVNLMLGTLVCSYDRDKASPQAIIAAVEAAGYGAAPADDAKRDIRREQDAAAKAMGRRLLWSAVCLVPLFYLSMGHMLGLPVPAFMHRQPLLAAAVQLALCLPILLLNRAYFTVGFSRLFKGSPNMDSLVALGAAAGLTYSLIEMGLLCAGQLAGMPDLYFESAGMILTLVTVGKYLEERSKGKTTGAITALLALAPETAVVRRNGTEVTVAADQIRAGETVIIRQGGRIPVDGTVTKGSGAVDESALTGESMPVEKTPGSSAVSATVLTSGYLELTADRVGADTTLSQIVQLMEQAAASKAPISRLADKISAVFVPVVISIAVLAAVLWATVGGMGIRFCLSIGIAVLVISCPCALGLATPVAITVATGKAAERGISSSLPPVWSCWDRWTPWCWTRPAPSPQARRRSRMCCVSPASPWRSCCAPPPRWKSPPVTRWQTPSFRRRRGGASPCAPCRISTPFPAAGCRPCWTARPSTPEMTAT